METVIYFISILTPLTVIFLLDSIISLFQNIKDKFKRRKGIKKIFVSLFLFPIEILIYKMLLETIPSYEQYSQITNGINTTLKISYSYFFFVLILSIYSLLKHKKEYKKHLIRSLIMIFILFSIFYFLNFFVRTDPVF